MTKICYKPKKFHKSSRLIIRLEQWFELCKARVMKAWTKDLSEAEYMQRNDRSGRY